MTMDEIHSSTSEYGVNGPNRFLHKQQGASMMSLSVTNAWVSSTTTFGSLIRGGLCGASAVYTVSLSLARRAPECMGTGSCSPLMS